MNSKSHRPESEFPSRKYPISLLSPRIESIIRDVAWRAFLGQCSVLPLGTKTPTLLLRARYSQARDSFAGVELPAAL